LALREIGSPALQMSAGLSLDREMFSAIGDRKMEARSACDKGNSIGLGIYGVEGEER
jgi:hypothetical protein